MNTQHKNMVHTDDNQSKEDENLLIVPDEQVDHKNEDGDMNVWVYEADDDCRRDNISYLNPYQIDVQEQDANISRDNVNGESFSWKIRKSKFKIFKKRRKNSANFESSNQFALLSEKTHDDEVPFSEVDEDYIKGMFIIGRHNMFKSRRSKKEKSYNCLNSSAKYATNLFKKMKKAGRCLEYFETKNRFQVLAEVYEENISDIIRKIDVLKMIFHLSKYSI